MPRAPRPDQRARCCAALERRPLRRLDALPDAADAAGRRGPPARAVPAATSCTTAASPASTSAGSGSRRCSPAPATLERVFEAALRERGRPAGRRLRAGGDGPRAARDRRRRRGAVAVDATSSARRTLRAAARVPRAPLGLPAQGGRSALLGDPAPVGRAEGGARRDPGRRVRRRPRRSGSTRSCSRTRWRALGLDARYGAYLDHLPGDTLATVNLMSLFGLHRRLRGAIVGHLALFEMTSSIPNRRYARGLRRLGLRRRGAPSSSTSTSRPTRSTRTSPRSTSPAGSRARSPALAGQILWGARALLAVEGALGRATLLRRVGGRASRR